MNDGECVRRRRSKKKEGALRNTRETERETADDSTNGTKVPPPFVLSRKWRSDFKW